MEGAYYHGVKLVMSGAILEVIGLSGVPEFVKTDPDLRARRNLRRIINANAGQWYDEKNKRWFVPLFLTLTFADNITDVAHANNLFRDFIQRFNYHFFSVRRAVLKYSAVIEFQERGAVHYHVILYNVPYVGNLFSRVSAVWGHGFVFINSIDDVRNVGSYVVKYMTKNTRDERLFRKKAYFNSRGLNRSVVIKDDFEVASVLGSLPEGSLQHATIMEGDRVYERHYLGVSFLRLLSSSRYKLTSSKLDGLDVFSVDIAKQGRFEF